MKALRKYDIAFIGLKDGAHSFNFDIDKTFFELFDFDEYEDAAIKADIELVKKSTLLEFAIYISGFIHVFCDLTNEPYNQPIDGQLNLVVKFGEEYIDNGDDIIVIPRGEHKVNIAQQLYELIVLSVPSKLVHPGISDGSLDSDIIQKLEELAPQENKKTNNSDKTDPRWDSLKNLITDK